MGKHSAGRERRAGRDATHKGKTALCQAPEKQSCVTEASEGAETSKTVAGGANSVDATRKTSDPFGKSCDRIGKTSDASGNPSDATGDSSDAFHGDHRRYRQKLRRHLQKQRRFRQYQRHSSE